MYELLNIKINFYYLLFIFFGFIDMWKTLYYYKFCAILKKI